VCGCIPTTCQYQGKDCGTIPDGCGGTLNCGSCTSPNTCGGGGAPNLCGTPPVCTCAYGYWSDGLPYAECCGSTECYPCVDTCNNTINCY
jgi:hypothetical protein